jgi:hypothetical protein
MPVNRSMGKVYSFQLAVDREGVFEELEDVPGLGGNGLVEMLHRARDAFLRMTDLWIEVLLTEGRNKRRTG